MLCRAWQIGVAAVAIQASAAFAQNFPTKPIRIVIPFTPGGALDTIGRLVSQNMTETLKQSVIVDYRAGAEGRASGKAR